MSWLSDLIDAIFGPKPKPPVPPVPPAPTPPPEPEPEPIPPPVPTPPPMPTTIRAPRGAMCLQSAQALNRVISEADLRLPSVTGVTVRVDPKWAEKDALAFVKLDVDRVHRTGKTWTLLHKGGIEDQPWTDVALNKHFAAVKPYANLYRNDLSLVGVHPFCAVSDPGTSEEPYWPTITPQIEAAYRKAIDWYAAQFPNCTLLMPVTTADTAACERLVNYAFAKYPSRVLVKTNNLKAKNKGKSIIDSEHHQLVVRMGRKGAMIGWEMVGATSEARFEGTLQQAYDNAKTLAKQAGQPISYLAVYPTDLRAIGNLK